jgi:hypothetical protein
MLNVPWSLHSVGNGFSQMRISDGFNTLQIGQCPGNFENALTSSRGKKSMPGCFLGQQVADLVKTTMFSDCRVAQLYALG